MALHHLPEDCADMPDLIEEKRAHGLSPANFWRGMGQWICLTWSPTGKPGKFYVDFPLAFVRRVLLEGFSLLNLSVWDGLDRPGWTKDVVSCLAWSSCRFMQLFKVAQCCHVAGCHLKATEPPLMWKQNLRQRLRRVCVVQCFGWLGLIFSRVVVLMQQWFSLWICTQNLLPCIDLGRGFKLWSESLRLWLPDSLFPYLLSLQHILALACDPPLAIMSPEIFEIFSEAPWLYPIFTGNCFLPPRGFFFQAKFPQTGVPGKQGSEQASKRASKQARQQGSKQASQQASKPASKQASQQASKPASQQASKPASQQASQPASKQAREPASKPSKQASQPASKQASHAASQATSNGTTVPLYHWKYCCRGGSVVMVGARIPRMGKWYV